MRCCSTISTRRLERTAALAILSAASLLALIGPSPTLATSGPGCNTKTTTVSRSYLHLTTRVHWCWQSNHYVKARSVQIEECTANEEGPYHVEEKRCQKVGFNPPGSGSFAGRYGYIVHSRAVWKSPIPGINGAEHVTIDYHYHVTGGGAAYVTCHGCS